MPPPQKFIDAHLRLETDTPPAPEAFETEVPVNGNRVENSFRERRDHHLDGLICTGKIPYSADETTTQIQQCKHVHGIRHAFVAQVDLLDPDIEKTLACYAGMERVTGVRQLMAWDQVRKAYRPGSINLLTDPFWRKRLELLKRHDLRFGI